MSSIFLIAVTTTTTTTTMATTTTTRAATTTSSAVPVDPPSDYCPKKCDVSGVCTKRQVGSVITVNCPNEPGKNSAQYKLPLQVSYKGDEAFSQEFDLRI